jgi:NarL family two-component system response regulator LiaR
MRRTLKDFIGDLVEGVYECRDGSQALAAYTQYRPDWVLMDILMEKVNGLEATRQIKAAYPTARIIMVTSCRGDHMKNAARVAGASEYVVKDNLQELRRILTKRTDDRPSQLIVN